MAAAVLPAHCAEEASTAMNAYTLHLFINTICCIIYYKYSNILSIANTMAIQGHYRSKKAQQTHNRYISNETNNNILDATVGQGR